MGVIRDYLTDAWIEERFYVNPTRSRRLKALARKAEKKGAGTKSAELESELDSEISSTKRHATVMWAKGMEVAEIRRYIRPLVEVAGLVVPRLDYGMVSMKHDGILPSAAARLQKLYGGVWRKSDQYYMTGEWHEPAQPLRNRTDLWMMAGALGDRVLAKAVSAPYRIEPVFEHLPHYVARQLAIRCWLAEDTANEQALAETMKPGYAAGIPPPLIEFPRAVFRRDEALLVKTARKLQTTFRGKWDIRKHRAWYDRRYRTFVPERWEKIIAQTKWILLVDWTLAWWGIAWINIARWRGMTSILDDTKNFSEWLPRAFCVDPDGVCSSGAASKTPGLVPVRRSKKSSP